jgi:hypothetical protein
VATAMPDRACTWVRPIPHDLQYHRSYLRHPGVGLAPLTCETFVADRGLSGQTVSSSDSSVGITFRSGLVSLSDPIQAMPMS